MSERGRPDLSDEALAIYEAACQPDDKDGHSHLTDVLEFGAEKIGEEWHEGIGEYVELFEGGFHVNDLVLVLIEEVEMLREVLAQHGIEVREDTDG